MKQQLAK